MLVFSTTAAASCDHFLEAERSRVASVCQRLFRRRMLMVDFLLAEERWKMLSSPLAGSCLGLHPNPWWHFQSWSSDRLGRGSPAQPPSGQGPSSANNTQEKNILLIVLTRIPEAILRIFLGLREKTACTIYK